MPVISRFFGIAVMLYWRDHAPPHFHVRYGDDEAMIEMRTGEVLRGTFPRRALSMVEEWRRLHVRELLADWERAQQRRPLLYIEPLE